MMAQPFQTKHIINTLFPPFNARGQVFPSIMWGKEVGFGLEIKRTLQQRNQTKGARAQVTADTGTESRRRTYNDIFILQLNLHDFFDTSNDHAPHNRAHLSPVYVNNVLLQPPAIRSTTQSNHQVSDNESNKQGRHPA